MNMVYGDIVALEKLLDGRFNSSEHIDGVLFPVLEELDLHIKLVDIISWLDKRADFSTYDLWKFCQKSNRIDSANYFYWDEVEDLQGFTLTSCKQVGDSKIYFETLEGLSFILGHRPSCCEKVYIESIVGDLSDLIGSPLITARQDSSEKLDRYNHWTFYNFATEKGYVTVRFNGEGDSCYYSLEAAFWKKDK